MKRLGSLGQVADPVRDLDIANKRYVDNIIPPSPDPGEATKVRIQKSVYLQQSSSKAVYGKLYGNDLVSEDPVLNFSPPQSRRDAMSMSFDFYELGYQCIANNTSPNPQLEGAIQVGIKQFNGPSGNSVVNQNFWTFFEEPPIMAPLRGRHIYTDPVPTMNWELDDTISFFMATNDPNGFQFLGIVNFYFVIGNFQYP